MRRIPVVIAIGSSLCLTTPVAHALSFGRVDNATVLGQPLDFAAVVSPSGGDESVDSECLAAEVFAGDNKLPAPLVRVRVEPSAAGRQASVRVTTTVRIDEPVVTVNLMIGCPVKLSRRFVAFVDPPVIALPRTVADAASDTTSVTTPASEPMRDAPPTTAAPRTDTAETPAIAAAPARARIASRPARRPPTAVVAAVAPHPAARRSPSRSSGTSAAAAASSVPLADRPASAPPRLVLDSAPASSASATPISAAASAILVAELESYARELAVERQRMKALEDSVERMRRDNDATRVSLAQVQSQLHDADAARGPGTWFYALLGLLVAVIAGLLWRQSRLKQRASWWSSAHETSGAPASTPESAVVESSGLPLARVEPGVDAETTTIAAVAPIVPGPLPMRDAPPPRPRGTARQSTAVALDAIEPSARHFDTQPMPPGSFQRTVDRSADDSDRPERQLSVEELIDIEQQAEFFVVLGQDDAAIDLLMGLLRSSGGQTPMPYLKLLEIYRRLDQHDAYDRIRERFNQRFNGVAPPIELDPSFGLDLTGYPDVLGRIQAAWGQPQQALTLVERLMPRASATDVENVFDLEAFGELLFLSRIARDLSDLDSGLQGVDFLLPLDADPLVQGPATLSLHAPYVPHKPMVDLTLDLDLDPSFNPQVR